MERFTAALVTSRVTPQSAAQISKPKVYRRVLVVFFSSLTIVALTLNLANTAKTAEPSKTEANMEGRIQELIPNIEAYVIDGMKGFDIPGVAIKLRKTAKEGTQSNPLFAYQRRERRSYHCSGRPDCCRLSFFDKLP